MSAESNLDLAATHNFIGGEWLPGSSAETLPVLDSATEEEIGRVARGSAADVDLAARSARDAFSAWATTPVEQRVASVKAIVNALEDRAEELRQVVIPETGTPISQVDEGQIAYANQILDGYIDGADSVTWEETIANSTIFYEPIGVVGGIVPWNYPPGAIASKLGAALIAGCTIVLKPSEIAPLDAVVFADAITAAGLPPGVVNFVFGTGADAGEPLVTHEEIDVISFTGSSRGGRRVSELAAASLKPVSLELGGKSASVVLEDGDLPTALRYCLDDCMLQLNGQVCDALSRLVVPRERLAEAEELAAEYVNSIVVGDPMDPETSVGPLASAQQQEKVLSLVDEAVTDGARVVAGGAGRPEGYTDAGYYVRATVLSGIEPTDSIARTEVFGPVVCLMAHDGDQDALEIANGPMYGLGGAVWSADG
ncbi:MAG TPA: aldehyde dehydrogenase family protein, partial [Solirubrobacterales bacterium]|nr:aldehyde dehydrogenase family protein [Solirubrobacterales bacterium]